MEHYERINSLDPLIKEALDIYIDWLNQHFGVSDVEEFTSEHLFEFADFFRYTGTNEKGTFWDRHYETQEIIDTKFANHRFICISAGIGDEGGPAYLYITVDETYERNNVVSIIQEFDTMHSLVYFSSDGYGEGERAKGIVPFSWSPQEASGETPQA